LDAAQVQVQNRVAQALPTLPDAVKAIGVSVRKQSPTFLMVVNLYSDVDPATGQPAFDQLYLSNFATIQVKDALARVEGVGEVFRLADVSRPELGARSQTTLRRLDGKPSVGLAVFQVPSANALDTAERVKATLRELKSRFPDKLQYATVYDVTPFINESVAE